MTKYSCNELINRINKMEIDYSHIDACKLFMKARIDGSSIKELPIIFEIITSIDEYAFYHCNNLALTSLPESITSIGNNAFDSCTNLALTSLPEGIISIDSYAFSSCAALTTLTFKGTPTSISSYAFLYCNNLKTINVPWSEGEVANAPWGATNATINYNYTGE